jgi:CMP-N,N'-diacetyllegionaminic acid synthase
MNETVAIIPARSGSKGLTDKNVRLLAGKPLLAYSIRAAKLTANIDRVIVSTDSHAYAGIAEQYGAEIPFLRPAAISGDRSTDYEFIRHAIDWFRDNEGFWPRYLVHLRPTTPLRDPQQMAEAIELIKANTSATALRSAHEMSETAYKTMEIEDGCLKSVYTGVFDLDAANRPRQMFPKTYQPNGYVDVIVSSFVMESQKLHGNRVLAYVSPFTVEVDNQDDFELLEYKISKKPSLVNRLFQ